MANVLFKRGSYKQLPASGSAVNGAIYMTEDEGGIYLGLQDGALKRMGDYVLLNTQEELRAYDLTNVGEYTMFYVKNDNILCRYDLTEKKFIQINAQQTASDLIKDINVHAAANGKVSINLLDGTGDAITASAGELNIAGAGAATVAGDNNNGITVTAEDHKAFLSTKSNTIQLNNTKATTGASEIAGSISFEGTGDLAPVITTDDTSSKVIFNVKAPKVTASVATADGSTTVTTGLANADGDYIDNTASSFTIKGAGDAKVTSAGNAITVTSDNTVAALSGASNKITLKNSVNGGTATVAGEISVAGEGNLGPAVTVNGNKLTVTVNGADSTAAFDANGNLSIGQIKDGDVVGTAASVKPVIKYGMGETKSTAVFANGEAVLNVPTVDEVNNLLKGLDAMTFKGVSSVADINKIQTANKGDTYKVSVAGKIGDTEVNVGDLVINNGADGAAPSWQIVPAGDETIYTYELVNSEGAVTLVDNFGDNAGAITAGNLINISGGAVSHAVLNPTSSENKSAGSISLLGDELISFTAVSGLTQDVYGHVTARTLGTYTVTPIKSLTSSFAVANNVATMTVAMADVDDTIIHGTQNITSDTLTMSANNNGALNMDIVWGSFTD